MSRDSAKVEATRRRLLDAARLGLARFGTRKLSMTDVARLAGVSRRTLYRYFPSMADLLDALGEDESNRFDAQLAAAVRDRPPGQRLEAVLRSMSESLSDDHLQQLVVTEPGFVLERFSTVLPTLRARLAALIVEESTAARVERPVAEDLADALIRLAMSYYLLPEHDPDRFERAIAEIVAAVLEPRTVAAGERAE